MHKEMDPETWLECALPVIRFNQWLVTALYRDRLIRMTIAKSVVIPESAYQPDGASALLALKSVGKKYDVALSAIESATLKKDGPWDILKAERTCWGVEVVSPDANFRLMVEKNESAHLLRGLQLLLDSRFHMPPEQADWLLPHAERPQKAKAPASAKITQAQQPYRSKPVGSLLAVIGLVILFGSLWLSSSMYMRQFHEQEAIMMEPAEQLAVELEKDGRTFEADEIRSRARGKTVELIFRPLGFGLIVAMIGVGLGGYCYGTGRRIRLPDLHEQLSQDSRRPILFLRSFVNDDAAVSKQRSGFDPNPQVYIKGGILIVIPFIFWLIHMLRGRDTSREEDHLAWFFRKYGPLVAIGKPGERITTTGASRAYVDDDKWQEFVLDMIERSQAVVLQIAATEGTWWEFHNCVQRVRPTHLLLLLTDVHGSQQKYEELRIRTMQVLPKPLPPRLGEAAFLRFDADWTPHLIQPIYRPRILWWFVDSVVNYQRSLTSFIANLRTESSSAAS